jgi:hypothetical protein
MRIDIHKLDDRIKKLQEIRRIATDPELATILLEFMDIDDPGGDPAMMSKPGDVSTPRGDSTQDLMKDVVNGVTPDAREGLWSRRR